MKNIKAALYVRVSLEIQNEGFSISAQVNELKQYCYKNNIEIYGIYKDEGISGTKENRIGLQKMLSETINFDIVLVHRYDRFARKVELSARLKARLKKDNVKVISITEPLEDSPIGFMQEGLLSLLSEYYIKNLSKEVKKGHIERASQGYYNGSLPYGYYAKDKKLYVKEDQAKIVKYIFRRYLEGVGCMLIARELQEKNILTQKNTQFCFSQTNYMLKNAKYAGKITYDGKMYDGQHEAIIDYETFKKVQIEMGIRNVNYSSGKKGYRSYNYNLFFLLDICKCENCGANFCMTGSEHKHKAYTCNKSYRKRPECPKPKQWNAKKFEKNILELLKNFMVSKIDIDFDIESTDLEINKELKERISVINRELERNKNAYIAGVFELEEFAEIKKRLYSEKKEIEMELNRPINYIPSKNIKKELKTIWDLFTNERDILRKRTILKKVISCIYVSKDGGLRFVFKKL